MTPLETILAKYRSTSMTEREKGTYFEELIRTYFRFEASYADLYSDIWLFADWAREIGTPQFGISAKDTGIDLVARTRGTEEYHAIQCKCFAPDYRVRKADIDSFFTASGRKPFTQRIIVTTTNDWSEHAEDALLHQQPPVYKIDLHDLELSQIDWAKYQPSAPPALKPKYDINADRSKHQKSALTNVMLGFKSADRGKLIMACGTGKTFTSLKIAEEAAGKGKLVLFLVPSLNLLSQTLTEWTQQSAVPLHSFAVCSDAEVGKKREADEDIVETFAHELRYPATTDAKRLAYEVGKRHDAQHMSVIFSTYHSLDAISRAQHLYGLPEVDLVICDEAHRTTGATFESEEESNFVRIHDNEFIRAAKRLYMTATPRIYGDSAKAVAEKDNVAICSMDDEAIYGKQLHVITFSEAVELKLLTDYKVLVLTIDEAHVSARLQDLLKDENNQLKVDDAARIIGCWKALAKQNLTKDLSFDPAPMRRAVAFCQVIERQKGARTHKVSSKQIAAMFQKVVDAYQQQEDSDVDLICEAAHVDGSMNAAQKEEKLTWLKAEPPPNTCRILSNVRCLSEGVDVPALDAVLFLTPRNSQVDVVQSVGRVMRRTPDGKKQLGYVILPVVIPAGMEPHDALNDNKVYKVVWDVLQALRSHDDRFDAFVNKLDLIGKDPRKMEVIAITDKIERKALKSKSSGNTKEKTGQGEFTIGTPETKPPTETQAELAFNVGELERALYAKVVKKCGNRNHWEDWANDIAKIANTHITRITQIVTNPENTREAAAFNAFAHELRDDLNDSITDGEVIEMLAQHLITRPVFDALFKEYSFAKNNPVSQAMQQVLDVLQEHRLEKEADTLEKFYASVERRAEGIDNDEGKQKIVVELYDKFFRNAFPKMTERLGIVYTPVEVVDFIIHSINDLLQSEFGLTLGSKGVHIIDPFTGTATFITRLLQSGLIKNEELPHKYRHEIHANEIVLLAYYIAAINIEAVYHAVVGGEYEAFQGICLTDTFQMYEKGDLVSELMEHNSARRKRQKALEVRVIMGNPPYSVGQKSDNDAAANVKYERLDESLKNSYVAASSGNPRSLYNSYIRAFRWASDRIGECGVIAYVSDAGWLRSKAADGFRACVSKEFDRIYVFDLRGDQRTQGEESRREGGKIFGSGSRTPISITLLVKNPKSSLRRQIFYRDIGDYLDQKTKLSLIKGFHSTARMTAEDAWRTLTPDEHNDWLDLRDAGFNQFIVLGDKKGRESLSVFQKHYSSGVKTNRDPWAYNASKGIVEANMGRMIDYYNRLLREPDAESSAVNDPLRISWSWVLRERFKKGTPATYTDARMTVAVYRPFDKTHMYYDRMFNENRYLMPTIFPVGDVENRMIVVKQRWTGDGQLALMVDRIVDIQSDGGSQCFPLYLYDDAGETGDDELFDDDNGATKPGHTRRDAITDAGLAHFQAAYPGEAITKEDLFYYFYGLLHSPDYRSRYADNLGKELPRIPAVKSAAEFRAFSTTGRELAHWHLHYETVPLHPGAKIDTGRVPRTALADADYRVTKMKFAKTRDPETKKSIPDKTTVIYNERITIRDIPLEAYEYVVNGKPALEWVMERQAVTTDKDSGIVNDANLWATETMANAQYPLELFLRVITVSLETMKIVNGLPKLDIAGTTENGRGATV
jgi:predicted helicase